jgi:hypothetical protein
MPAEDRGGKQVLHVVELDEAEPVKKPMLVEEEQIQLSRSLLLATSASQEPAPFRTILHPPAPATQTSCKIQS